MITMSAAMTDLLVGPSAGDMTTSFCQFIHEAGNSTETSAIFGYFGQSNPPMLVARYADYDKLVAALESNDFTPQANNRGTLEVYGSDDNLVALTESHILFTQQVGALAESAIRQMENAASQAANKSLDATAMGRALSDQASDMAIAFTFPEKMTSPAYTRLQLPEQMLNSMSGMIYCASFKLTDNSLDGTVRAIDAKGKPIDIMESGFYTCKPGKVNSKALAYLGDDEQLALAYNLKGLDWNKIFDELLLPNVGRSERVGLSLARTYLEKFDGTIALGIGLTNGLTSINNLDKNIDPGQQFSATLVLETAHNKAESLLTDVRSLLDSTGQPYRSTDNGLTLDISGMSLFCAVESDLFIISNNPISDKHSNNAVKKCHMADYGNAVALVMPEDNKLMRDMDLKYSVTAFAATEANTTEGKIQITVKDDKSDKFIEKMIRLTTDLQQRAKNL
ncbi:MAG: DUF4836 family protein, partial [Muribaculaceae bacterium]|nr:DUF4836 family protein [Muribaculaceae bacterium]